MGNPRFLQVSYELGPPTVGRGLAPIGTSQHQICLRAEGRDYTLERRARATSSASHAPHQRRERRLEAQRAAAASTAAAAAAASLHGGSAAAADCKHQQPAARHAAAWGRVGSAAHHLAARHAPDLSCAAAPPLPRAAPSPPPHRPLAVSAALLGRTRPCRPQLLCRQRRRRHGPSRRCRRSHARRPRCRRSSMADTATTTAPGRLRVCSREIPYLRGPYLGFRLESGVERGLVEHLLRELYRMVDANSGCG